MTTVASVWVATCSDTLPWRKPTDRAKAARAKDDGVEVATISDPLDGHGRVAGRFEHLGLDPGTGQDVAGLDQLLGVDASIIPRIHRRTAGSLPARR